MDKFHGTSFSEVISIIRAIAAVIVAIPIIKRFVIWVAKIVFRIILAAAQYYSRPTIVAASQQEDDEN